MIPLSPPFIFGYGINLDSSKLRVGILLEQRSEAALDFTHTMTGSPYIDATISDNRQATDRQNAGGENSRSGGYSGGFCGTDGARQRHRTDSGDHRRQ
ncbi:hypothetical protein ACLB1N_04250 [Escherichia coli]